MLLRGQGTFLSDDEINNVVAHASQGEQNFVKELVHLKVKEEEEEGSASGGGGKIPKRDDLYEDAIEVVVREGRGSCSLLQRALGIGYGRAARMIDWMAEDGVVGAYSGSRAREVLMSMADLEVMRNGDPNAEPPSKIKSTAPLAKTEKPKVNEVAIMKGGSQDTSSELAEEIAETIQATTSVVKSKPPAKKAKPKKKAPVEVDDEEDELDEAAVVEDGVAEDSADQEADAEEEDEFEYVEVDEGDEEYEYVYEDADPDEEYEDGEYEYEYEEVEVDADELEESA
jgi:S-DNA-T family DNA segregation ATPase FtsK/SpoIIIE